ncbi:MAG: geranylgeranyl reductase family protein [Desulfobacterales bacterium]|nr:geranylgeranyl reductase family protein [Desulfobacterales bacterium]
MAAVTLARSGLKVVLLEKASLPREKPCGGGIPKNALKELDWDFQCVVEQKVTRIRYLNNFRMEKTYPISKPLLMVNRKKFDYELICHAGAIGKQDFSVREGFPVESIEERENSVRIKGLNGETIAADVVIATDGANSRAGRQIGLVQERAKILALDAAVEVSPKIFEEIKTTATFNISCLPQGYGWIFPKDGYLSCGVGGSVANKRLSAIFDHFIRKSFPDGGFKVIGKKIHPVPIFTGRSRLATRRLCLAGDAARLVDPVMGEGIRYALQSGSIAAKCIMDLFCGSEKNDSAEPAGARETNGLLAYSKTIHRRIGRELDLLYRFALPLFWEQPEFFYRKFFYEGFNYLETCRGLAQKMGLSAREVPHTLR